MRLLDRINSLPATEAVQAALTIIDRAQVLAPEAQVAGIALVLHVMRLELGLDLSELMNKAQRMADQGDLMRQVSALRDYVKGEVR